MFLLANIVRAVGLVLETVLNLYFFIVLIACVISFVKPDPYNPIVRTLTTLTEPVFRKIRQWLPFTYFNGIDFSPIVLLLAIKLVDTIVVRTLLQYAATLD